MQRATLPQIQQWNTKKRYGIFSKLTVKTPDERRCFLMSPCHEVVLVGTVVGEARCTMRRTRVPPNVTRSTKLREGQRSRELAFKSTDFLVPENLIFLALLLVKSINNLSYFNSAWNFFIISNFKSSEWNSKSFMGRKIFSSTNKRVELWSN